MIYGYCFIKVLIILLFDHYILDKKINWAMILILSGIFSVLYTYIEWNRINFIPVQMLIHVCLYVIFSMVYFRRWDNHALLIFMSISVMYSFYSILFFLLLSLLDLSMAGGIGIITETLIIVTMKGSLKYIKDILDGMFQFRIGIINISILLLMFFSLMVSIKNQRYIVLLISFYMFVLCIIACVITYMKMEGIRQNKTNLELFIDISQQQMITIYKDYEQLETMIHDTKHKAVQVYEEIQNNRYESVKPMFDDWIEELSALLHMPLCNNTVVDLVLSSKMELYQELEFQLNLKTRKDGILDTKVFSSLLLLVVDMSCQSLLKTGNSLYDFKIFMDENSISIFSEYKGNENTKDVHLLEQFIEDLNGDVYIDKDGIHILILR